MSDRAANHTHDFSLTINPINPIDLAQLTR